MNALRVLGNVDWWVALVGLAIALVGWTFIRSATLDDARFAELATKHAAILAIAAGSGLAIVLVPYARIMRRAWLIYGLAVLALLLLPVFGCVVNGARRWYCLPGFSVQPSEFAKLAVIVVLAAYLRFRSHARTADGLLVPMLIAGVPALLVLRQPDLGSSLVFGPVLLAMCFAAGAPARALVAVIATAMLVGGLGYLAMHDYQRARVTVWAEHFGWTSDAIDSSGEVRQMLLGDGYQPWQALIAIGSGGATGFGLEQGPQNRYGFLPYRFDDYVFAVVAEETGLLGALGLIGLQMLLALGLFGIALRTRERFGRLLVVGIATWLGSQSLMHAAVCTWLVPATGLPMPLVSYGGSSTLASIWALALALNVSARREPVLASDGYS